MVVYVGSGLPLPLIPWRESERAFNVTELTEHEEPVRTHFKVANVRQAGSHTQCGCGFNEWRDTGDEVQEIWGRSDEANTSIAKLVSYLREHRVESIYSCWSGDEGKHRLLARRMKPEGLAEPYFQFQERELLTLDHTP
jgi:hypothetical protein